MKDTRLKRYDISTAITMAILFFFLPGTCVSQDKATAEDPRTEIVDKKESRYIEFLRDKKKALEEPGKVLNALDELATIAEQRKISSRDTISVLLRYLDVPRSSLKPFEKSQSGNIVQTHPVVPESLFPAVIALHRIGKATHPLLIEIIGENPTESTKVHNAIFLIVQSYPEDWNKAAEYIHSCLPLARTDEAKRRLVIATEKILDKVNKIRSIEDL